MDYHAFYEGSEDFCCWKNSYVRAWLNVKFYESLPEKDRVRIMITDIGETKDKVFLLSAEEAEQLPEAIRDILTELHWWWLRTPAEMNDENTHIMGVSGNGALNRAGYAPAERCGGIRPAIMVMV